MFYYAWKQTDILSYNLDFGFHTDYKNCSEFKYEFLI